MIRETGEAAPAAHFMRIGFPVLFAFMAAGPLLAETPTWPEIRNVTARQRSPWNGKVDISYTIVGNMKDFSLSISASDGENGTNYVADASAVTGSTGTEAGDHKVVWDFDAQGIEVKSTSMVFTVSYVLEKPQYCVLNLCGSAAGCSVEYMGEPPSAGFNSAEYKTTKLVLRMIEPGSFLSNGRFSIAITKPYYIGLFEVTQRQYELVMGRNPSYYTYSGDARPVESVSWNDIRGNSSQHNWPNKDTVGSDSFIGRLRAWTGMRFDLPTEAQWEYACRAGTASDYNNGGSSESDMSAVGQYDGNRKSSGAFQQHTTVGTYKANSWGLYDMHGNVSEWCLDWYGSWSSGMVDPVGASSGSARVFRGGSWYAAAMYCTSSYRSSNVPGTASDKIGFRIALPLSE